MAYTSHDEAKKEYRGFFEWKEFVGGWSPGDKWADLYQIRLIAQEGGTLRMEGKSKENDFVIRAKVWRQTKVVEPPPIQRP